MNQKRIIGGHPIYVYVVTNNKQYPEIARFEQEVARYYDAIYYKKVQIEKISDLDTVITSPQQSLVVLLTKQLMMSDDIQQTLDKFKERNVRVVMFPIKISSDPYFSVANNIQDIHKIVYSLKKTFGASQQVAQLSSQVRTTLEQNPQYKSNYGSPSIPISNNQAGRKVPVYILQSLNDDFGKFANSFSQAYKNNQQVNIRPIKSFNDFAQTSFHPLQQPILLVSNAQINKLTPQLNMFKTSSQTKIHTIVYKNQRNQIPNSYNLIGNTENDMNQHITQAIATSFRSQFDNQLRPNTPINNLTSNQNIPHSKQLIPRQSGVGSHSARQNYLVNTPNKSGQPSVGSRATSFKTSSSPYKSTGKIRLKSAKKIMSKGAIQNQSILIVCDNNQNQHFTQFCRSMPYPFQVVPQMPKDLNLHGPRTIILAPYQLRQHVLGNIPKQAQNIGVVFYSPTPYAPDMLVKHRFVDLTTYKPQQIAQYFQQQNFKSINQPTMQNTSIMGMSGIHSVVNSQNMIPSSSNTRTMQWFTHPTGPGTFVTMSSQNKETIPKINSGAYKNQTFRPSAPMMAKSQNLNLQYPASVQASSPYAQKPIADALQFLIADIRSQKQYQQIPNTAISQTIANAVNQNLLQQMVITKRSSIKNPQNIQYQMYHPEVQTIQTKTVRKQIIQNIPAIPNPQLVYPNPVSVPQSNIRSSQAYRQRSIQESQFEKRNTARFNNSGIGHHQWTVERDGGSFHTTDDVNLINNQRAMSFKNKNLDSNISQQLKYEQMLNVQGFKNPQQQNKMMVNPNIPIQPKLFVPQKQSNINMFNYKGNNPPMQWDLYRSSQSPHTFNLIPHSIYQSLPAQQKYIMTNTNELLLQSQNHPYGLSQIPTISKLSKMQKPPGNMMDNIAKASTTLITSGRNQIAIDNVNQMEWNASRKGQSYNITNANQINRSHVPQYNTQNINISSKGIQQQSIGTDRFYQTPVTKITTTTNHKRIITNSQEQEILYDLNKYKGGPTMQNPIFPSFGAKQINAHQKTLNEFQDDKQIAAMIFNNNFIPGRQRSGIDGLNDSRLEQIHYSPRAQTINYQKNQSNQQIPSYQQIQNNKPIQSLRKTQLFEPSLQQRKSPVYGPQKNGLMISQPRQPQPIVQQINYQPKNIQSDYFTQDNGMPSPLTVNNHVLQAKVDPSFSPHQFNNQYNFNSYSPRRKKPPQIDRQVVQIMSTPEQNKTFQKIVYQRKYDGSIAQTFVNNLRQSKSVGGDEINQTRLSRQLAGSRSGKKGIFNTVIDNNFQNITYQKQFDAGKFDGRNQNGIVMYSRKKSFRNSRVSLSPKVQTSQRFGAHINNFAFSQANSPHRNIIPTKDYGQSSNNQYISNYNTIMNKAIDQPIQILFRRSTDFMHQIANGFQHPPFQIQKYNNLFELESICNQLSPQLMTVLVTDQIPNNIQKIFSNFSNFNCVVVPNDKLYKIQQSKYPTYKWITQTNPITVIYKIRDYLNRYNYITETPAQRLLKTQKQNSFSATYIPKNINIMISQVLKNKLLLQPTIQHQVFSNDRITNMLDQSKTNIIVIQQNQVQSIQQIVKPQDKILVLQRENQISLPSSPAELSTKNPAAILGYITRLLKQSGGSITIPQVFYHFDQIDLQQTIQKRLGGRVTQIKYHDKKSLIRKVRQSTYSQMILILDSQFIDLIQQIRQIQPNCKIIQYKPHQPMSIPNTVVARSITQVLNELERLK